MTVQHDRTHTTDRPIAGAGRTSRAGLHQAWVRGCADAVFGRTVNVCRTEAECDAWRQGHEASVLLERAT